MREYSNRISLIKNGRGIYCLDTSVGCKSGMENEINGCYNDCYAAKSAKQYGYDFNKTILRFFDNEYHRREVIKQINNVSLDFIRIGCSGDPSENWNHAISIIEKIKNCNKQIVIITRHWTLLTDEQLEFLSSINICINTSVSALDKDWIRENCLAQYKRTKQYCKSVLRVISCDLNLENELGHKLFKIQKELFQNENVLDTVFRPSKKNKLVVDNVIKISNSFFNGHKAIVSKFNRKTFTGKCPSCQEMCGINIKDKNNYQGGVQLVKQQRLFK